MIGVGCSFCVSRLSKRIGYNFDVVFMTDKNELVWY